MKHVKIEYVDGVKYTTYTKERAPRANEKTFSISKTKYSVWGAGRKKETLGKGER